MTEWHIGMPIMPRFQICVAREGEESDGATQPLHSPCMHSCRHCIERAKHSMSFNATRMLLDFSVHGTSTAPTEQIWHDDHHDACRIAVKCHEFRQLDIEMNKLTKFIQLSVTDSAARRQGPCLSRRLAALARQLADQWRSDGRDPGGPWWTLELMSHSMNATMMVLLWSIIVCSCVMLRGLFGNVWNMHQFSELVALCMPYVMGVWTCGITGSMLKSCVPCPHFVNIGGSSEIAGWRSRVLTPEGVAARSWLWCYDKLW